MNLFSKNSSNGVIESHNSFSKSSAKKLQNFFRNKIVPIVFAGSVAVSANVAADVKDENATPNFEKEKSAEVVKSQKNYANPKLGENKEISKLLKIGKDGDFDISAFK